MFSSETTGRNKLKDTVVALGSQAAKLQSVAVSVGGDLNTQRQRLDASRLYKAACAL